MKMSILICYEYFCMINSYSTGTEQKNYLVMIKIDPVVRKRGTSVFFQEWTPRENPKNMKKRRGRGGGRKIVLKTKGLMS